MNFESYDEAVSSSSAFSRQRMNAKSRDSNGKGILCQTCEQVINQLKEQLEDPKFEAQIKRQVRHLCEYLKVTGQDEQCRGFVYKYVDEAIDFIRNLSPSMYCQSIQLCEKSQKVDQLASKRPALTDFADFGIETSVKVNEVSVKNIDSTATTTKRSPTCTFCKAFIKEMFKFLKDNRTEESVRNGLDRICKIVYRDQNKLEECESIVAAYTKQLVELLVDETDPELICMIIEECTYASLLPVQEIPPAFGLIALKKPQIPELEEKSTSTKLQSADQISLSQFISMLDDQVKVGSLRSCVECKLFIKYLQDAIRDPKSQEQVKEWLLENLCEQLGEEELKNSCRKMVDKNSAAFFEAIVNELNPQVTCVEVGACRNRSRTLLIDNASRPIIAQKIESSPKPKPKPQTLQSSLDSIPFFDPITSFYHMRLIDPCGQCVDLITRFDEYLSTHAIDHDVNSLIDNVCGSIPDKSAKESCSEFVRKYGQIIIHAVENMDSPKQLCTKIMLCSS